MTLAYTKQTNRFSFKILFYDPLLVSAINQNTMTEATDALTDVFNVMPVRVQAERNTYMTDFKYMKYVKQSDGSSCGYFAMSFIDWLTDVKTVPPIDSKFNEYRKHVRDIVIKQLKLALGDDNIQRLLPVPSAAESSLFLQKIVSPLSQYSVGSVSSCTVMALECSLHLLHGEQPSVELVEKVLWIGSGYKSDLHTSLDDILPRIARYNKQLEQADTIQRSVDLMSEVVDRLGTIVNHGFRSASALLTKPPESVLIHWPYPSLNNGLSRPMLFDSHRRPEHDGAAILVFENQLQLTAYLRRLWPPIQLGDGSIQEAMLNTVEANYLHLRPSIVSGTIPDLAMHDDAALKSALAEIGTDMNNVRKGYEARKGLPSND